MSGKKWEMLFRGDGSWPKFQQISGCFRANSVMAVISETVIYKKLQMLPFVIISDSFQKPERWRESNLFLSVT